MIKRFITRIGDWLRELEIRGLLDIVSDPTIPFAIRMECWEDARALIARRSPPVVGDLIVHTASLRRSGPRASE